MTNPLTYKIEKVQDFLNVPADRIADCLDQFALFIETIRHIREAVRLTGAAMGVDAKFQISDYTWIDDGKQNVKVEFLPMTAYTVSGPGV